MDIFTVNMDYLIRILDFFGNIKLKIHRSFLFHVWNTLHFGHDSKHVLINLRISDLKRELKFKVWNIESIEKIWKKQKKRKEPRNGIRIRKKMEKNKKKQNHD